nr:hypothetical protein [Tanacetum cinerariifolium]
IRDITTTQIVMANSNPENLNVPNEGVPEGDPHHLLDYDEEEDPEMDIEEEEPEEELVEEPEPLAGHEDQFDAHPNPQPGNMNGWVEEAGVKPEAKGADVELEAEEPDGESSTARDPQFVGGLAPWALRTEVALLGSEAKIRKMEREILHHDLSGVEETLGKNATLRKKLAEKEVLLDLTRMERDKAKK